MPADVRVERRTSETLYLSGSQAKSGVSNSFFIGGHISLAVAFKGLNVILGLYKCNYSLTRGRGLYIQPFEGNHKDDVAPGENELERV